MKTDAEVKEQPVSQMGNLLGGLVDEETMADLMELEQSKLNPPADDKNKKKEAPKPEGKKNEKPEGEEKPEEEEQEEGAEGKVKKDVKSKKDNADEEEEEESEEEEDDEKDEVKLQNNKFGINIGGKKDDKNKAKLDIKSFDELPAALKSKYGQDIKNPKALVKFLETSVDKWRTDSQNLEKVVKEKDNAIAVFENLPSDLLDAVKMHYEGQDYRKAFESNVRIDFSKPVDKHKPKTLVNAFYPGEFTDEDFDAEEPSKELKIAIKASEKEYNLEKSTREQRAKDHVHKAELKSKAYKESVKSSVSALKSAFPDMAADVQADVEHTLSSGALMSEFFNPDGTYKPHAAKALMLAKHGEELIGQLMEIAERRGESFANEEMVKRSSGKPKEKKGGQKEEPMRKEVADTVDKLLPPGLANKRVF